MKEIIIEKIKQTKIYPMLKSFLFQTKERDYKQNFLTPIESNLYISNLLNEKKPFIVSRLGTTELGVLKYYMKNKKYKNKQKEIIQRYSGFFPTDDNSMDNFCKLYTEIIPDIDLSGISFIPFEDYMLNTFAPNTKITKIRNLEPYFFDIPWSKYLRDKKVLVIHPFSESIEKQYIKREKLFKNQEVLPTFRLTVYPAAQTLGGGDGSYNSWFEALEKMKKDIEKIDFDIAIIGAGVYGLPLASFIKSLNKSAIHLGGSTQILFGVYGQRWAIHPDFKDIINEYWVKPTPNETPKTAKNVENACYW